MKLTKLRSSSFSVLLLLFFTFSNAVAQSALFSSETYTNAEGESLDYRLLTCDYDTTSKYPLVIFLHGSGERGSDNEAQLKWGVLNFASDNVMKLYRPIVIAPQCPENLSWENVTEDTMSMLPNPSKPMQLLIELINKSAFKIPDNQSVRHPLGVQTL